MMAWDLATAAQMLAADAESCGLVTTNLHDGTIGAGDVSIGFVRWPDNSRMDMILASDRGRKTETFEDPHAMVDRVARIVRHHTGVNIYVDAAS
jgi:hypothetical protein